jgi:tetratricopeptide (TPR) repeat protein
MQAAAITSFFTGRSSNVELADSGIVVSHGRSIHQIIASHLTQSIHSHETFLKLANALIHSAEQAYMLRDVPALQEVSTVLMNLPIEGAQQIGLYYYALAISRNGQIDEAEGLLESVADDNAPITFRARAIQTLGANQHTKSQLDEALRFQLEALRAASDKSAHGLQTTLLAYLQIAHLKSDWGDHKGSLDVLESLSPLVEVISRRNPLYFYFYHNELGVEFGELNRIAEAQAASAIALASPFASAYPEWSETRQELEAKRTSATPSVVTVSQTFEVTPSPQTQPQPCPVQPQPNLIRKRIVAFCWLSSRGTFHKALVAIVRSIAIANHPANRIILDQLGRCIRSRAPPA